MLIRRLPGRRAAARSPFRDWEEQVGRNAALVIAVLVIPDRCTHSIGEGVSSRLELIVELIDTLEHNKHAWDQGRHAWVKRATDRLERAAKSYRELPVTVLDSGRPVPCAVADWPRRNLIPWFVSIGEDLLDHALFDGRQFEGDLQTVIDYLGAAAVDVTTLLNRMYGDVREEAEAWHARIARRRLEGPSKPAAKVLHRWNDGYVLYELETHDELDEEGAHMGHCVSSHMAYDISRGLRRILSLRDSRGRPKVTVEIGQEPYPDVDDAPLTDVLQAKGPGNSVPSDRHALRLAAWLLEANPGLHYASGDEHLASQAEALQVAAKLLREPPGTRMDLHLADTTDPRHFQGTLWLEPRAGKRPYLHALARPFGVTVLTPVGNRVAHTYTARRVLDGDVALVDQFIFLDTLHRLILKQVLTEAGIPWVDDGRSWDGRNLQPVYREVLPPTLQEVATTILKLRRLTPFKEEMAVASELLREISRAFHAAGRQQIDVLTHRVVAKLLQQAWHARGSKGMNPSSWPPTGQRVRLTRARQRGRVRCR